jgi:uncharacterized protein
MIQRTLYQKIRNRLNDTKAIILYGPRQAGKTTLLKQIFKEISEDILWWNGDEPDIRSDLTNSTSVWLKKQIGKRKFLIIDEAQRIENIGLVIKLIVDQIPGVKVIASGSSSFDLSNKINEPLTGRKWEFMLYPLSVDEMIKHTDEREEKRLLSNRLLFGFYPDIVNHPGEERILLNELAGSYLYKDILTWENIQKPAKLEKLLQALAHQIGSQVSINELSQITGLDNHTVERYISLLEKAYIIFQLRPLSRNLRNEIKKSRKIYFYDNGIRNAVINQFSPVEMRPDKGQLWENFLMCERKKMNDNSQKHHNRYFWRNHAQQEIDYVEERDGVVDAYEFKWNPKSRVFFSKSFINAYKPENTLGIHRENYLEFVLPN